MLFQPVAVFGRAAALHHIRKLILHRLGRLALRLGLARFVFHGEGAESEVRLGRLTLVRSFLLDVFAES